MGVFFHSTRKVPQSKKRSAQIGGQEVNSLSDCIDVTPWSIVRESGIRW